MGEIARGTKQDERSRWFGQKAPLTVKERISMSARVPCIYRDLPLCNTNRAAFAMNAQAKLRSRLIISTLRSDVQGLAHVAADAIARRSHAGVVKLVDAPDSKSGSERSVG